MIGLSRIGLGFTPSSGHASVTQAIKFKELARGTIGSVDDAYLVTVLDGNRRGIEVVYDSSDPKAEAWAREAKDAAPGIWDVIGRMDTRTLAKR